MEISSGCKSPSGIQICSFVVSGSGRNDFVLTFSGSQNRWDQRAEIEMSFWGKWDRMSHRTMQSLLNWCFCPTPRAGTISNKEAYYKHTICPTIPNTSSVPPWLVMILMDLLVAFLQGKPCNLPKLEFFYFNCYCWYKIYRGVLFLFFNPLDPL